MPVPEAATPRIPSPAGLPCAEALCGAAFIQRAEGCAGIYRGETAFEVFAVFPGDRDGYDSEYFAASGVYRGELF